MTPHIEAKQGDIAKTVLMPGDPLRARFIAKNYLEDVVQYNGIRGMLGFTGLYKGQPVSVQGSGMGMPSIGIYSYELYHLYHVDTIIRIGTAGSLQDTLQLKDLVIGMGACTDSHFAKQYGLGGTYAPIASYHLLEKAVNAARKKEARFMVGNILSSDVFYRDDPDMMKQWQKMNVLAVEMEAAALYMNAARLGKNALAMFTISDCMFTGEQTTAQERQTAFTTMMEVALETALSS